MNPILAHVNPILARELVKRMRGAKAMFKRSVYLGFLGLVFTLIYHVEVHGLDRRFGNSVVDWASVGQGMFEWTLLVMLLLVLFLVPGATAGSIVGERQRLTLISVQISLMRPLGIVLGKLGASVVFILLLVVATMPLLTVAHLIGGITFLEIVKGLSMIMFTTVCIAAGCLSFSAIVKSSRTAIVMSYLMVLILFFATFMTMIAALLMALFTMGGDAEESSFIGVIVFSSLSVNPVVALSDVVGSAYDPSWIGDSGGGPLSGLKRMVAEGGAQSGWMFMPLWMLNVVFYGAMMALSLFLAADRVQVPRRVPR